MAASAYVAFDLGAESGRAMVATLEGDRLKLEEVHRFPNLPQRLPSGLHWNLLDLWANLVEGLRKAGELAQERGFRLVSLGVDTWGVDFGLLGKSGQLLGLPYAYRDERTEGVMEKACDAVGQSAIYEATGIQFLRFNTLFQLLAQQEAEPETLDHATRLLFVPDLLHYFFCGRHAVEATIASTSQMIDPRTGNWADALLKKLRLPTHFLEPAVPAGTKIGEVRPEIAEQAGVTSQGPIDVILPGSHDTASAVAAVPAAADTTDWAYLSSGTWSLMGTELDEPRITRESEAAGFTNERGVGGKIRFLKNIAGLWLVQEVRRDYAGRDESYSYAQLTEMAAEAQPLRTLVNPDDASFVMPGDMCAKIDAFARRTDQPVPQTPGAYVRCCLESLAFAYRRTLRTLEDVLGRDLGVLHIVGGGGRNTLLNQMTADATGKPVMVGPYEATAIGNALAQAMGRGQVRDLPHLREIVRRSSELTPFEPRNTKAYDAADSRFLSLIGR